MKVLTLNTHAWNEADPKEKFQAVVNLILEETVDVICLQEVNQFRMGKVGADKGTLTDIQAGARAFAEELKHELKSQQSSTQQRYRSVQQEISVADDNYAKLLVSALADAGQTYYWSWAPAHIGYDCFDEGVAILSRYDFWVKQIILDKATWPYADYHRRVAVKASIDVPGIEEKVSVYSSHFSWWEADGSGFQAEWDTLNRERQRVNGSQIFCGDFNQIAEQPGAGYDYIKQTAPDLKDSYQVAMQVSGDATIPGEIDGWRHESTPKRIDYAWVSDALAVTDYQTVFTGKNYPVASDHFGIMITIQ
ncbi:MAG: endonuclease/exonuclease/phosphatase family protein [Aerococcus sp.]|nr:endonuclease/exonuclease/phosphatase family protein [Aerococcus sp.]